MTRAVKLEETTDIKPTLFPQLGDEADSKTALHRRLLADMKAKHRAELAQLERMIRRDGGTVPVRASIFVHIAQ